MKLIRGSSFLKNGLPKVFKSYKIPKLRGSKLNFFSMGNSPPPSRQMDLRLSVYPSLTVTLSERFELTKFYHFSS